LTSSRKWVNSYLNDEIRWFNFVAFDLLD